MSRTSVPELLAAAFRASATGSLVISHGGGENRIYLRYGAVCGVVPAGGGQPLAEFLAVHDLVDPEVSARTQIRAEREGRRHGEILVEDGVLTEERLQDYLFLQHCHGLAEVCLVREGRYELRGWERPPVWTEPLALDPLRSVIAGLEAEGLADRRAQLADVLRRLPLRPGLDYERLSSRLIFEPGEEEALHRAVTVGSFQQIDGLEPERAEALLCAVVLLGLVEPPVDATEPVPLEMPAHAAAPPSGLPTHAPAPVPRGRLDQLEAEILSEIGEVLAGMEDDAGRPVTLEEPSSAAVPLDDALALQAAMEGAIEEARFVDAPDAAEEGALDAPQERPTPPEEEPPLLFTSEDDFDVDLEDGDEAPATDERTAVAEETTEALEASGVAEPQPAPPPPQRPVRPREDTAAIRRRLLKRAMRNVVGTVFDREESRPAPSEPTPPPRPEPRERTAPPRPDHTVLAKDIDERVARLPRQDHFARLDLSPRATTEQVKAAFLGLAKRYHPDRLSAAGQSELLPKVRELFAAIKESYDVLLEPGSRAAYAAELEKASRKKELSPEEGRAIFARAEHHLRRNDARRAETELRRLVEADPRPRYLAELAWTLYTNPGRRQEALGEIRALTRRAIEGSPAHDRAFALAAQLAQLDGDTERFERYARRALEINPRNPEAARELRLHQMRRRQAENKGFLGRLFGK